MVAHEVRSSVSRDEHARLGSLVSNTSALGSSARLLIDSGQEDALVDGDSLCALVSGVGGQATYQGEESHCQLKSMTAPLCLCENLISGFNFDCVYFDVDPDKRFINFRSFNFAPTKFQMISAAVRFVSIRGLRPLSQRGSAKLGRTPAPPG